MVAHRVALRLPIPGLDHVARGVAPVEGALLGRPRQPVGGRGVVRLQLHQRLAFLAVIGSAVDAVKVGLARVLGLVVRAGPEAAERIGLAVVEARGRAVLEAHDGSQSAAPAARAVDAIAQGKDQAAARRGCDAARVLRQRPRVLRAARRMPSAHAATGDVDPVQPLLARMPERRFARRIGLGDSHLPRHAAGSAAMRNCATSDSPGCSSARPRSCAGAPPA